MEETQEVRLSWQQRSSNALKTLYRRLLPASFRESILKTRDSLKWIKRRAMPVPKFAHDSDFEWDWSDRIRTMRQEIGPSDSILDLGCGKGLLEPLLMKTNTYYGCDFVQRKPTTFVADFNKLEFPILLVDSVDVVFISGVIEYLTDWKWFLNRAMEAGDKLVLSYCTLEQFSPRIRIKSGWINSLRLKDLTDFFSDTDFTVKKIRKHDYGTILVVERSPK